MSTLLQSGMLLKGLQKHPVGVIISIFLCVLIEGGYMAFRDVSHECPADLTSSDIKALDLKISTFIAEQKEFNAILRAEWQELHDYEVSHKVEFLGLKEDLRRLDRYERNN